MEEVIVDVDPEFQGLIIENMSKRNGDMIELKVPLREALQLQCFNPR